MKKLMRLIAASVAALMMTTTAFATEIESDSSGNPIPESGNTAVTLSIDPAYTIVIPESVELEMVSGADITYENDLTITAEAGMRIDEDKTIVVSMTSDFELTSDASKLPYTVTIGGSSISSGDTVAAFATNENEQTSTLHFAADDPTYAGDYSDTVTFNIAVK